MTVRHSVAVVYIIIKYYEYDEPLHFLFQQNLFPKVVRSLTSHPTSSLIGATGSSLEIDMVFLYPVQLFQCTRLAFLYFFNEVLIS